MESKRRRRANTGTRVLIDVCLNDSSSDSDFKPTACDEHSSSCTDMSTSDEESSSGKSDTSLAEVSKSPPVRKLIRLRSTPLLPTPQKHICCVCLENHNNDVNKIVECAKCAISVHEYCYCITDNESISKSMWFCDACRGAVSNPDCELCPNTGGLYRETEIGKYVHLICALYVRRVTFIEIHNISFVTLFTMPYSFWGSRTCSLCDNGMYACTGVSIECDAGLCKTYFHVTCAQKAGFLVEVKNYDDTAADPYYANCTVHSDKEIIKKRKLNYKKLQLKMVQKARERKSMEGSGKERLMYQQLLQVQMKHSMFRKMGLTPWVPTQKLPRLLNTSASACRRMNAKAQTMFINIHELEQRKIHEEMLTSIHKKRSIPPSFSVEFIAYYEDRVMRIDELKQQHYVLVLANEELSKDQALKLSAYENALIEHDTEQSKRNEYIAIIKSMHNSLELITGNKNLMSIQNNQLSPEAGISFDWTTFPKYTCRTNANSIPSCIVCKQTKNQHLLVKCDNCASLYHINCLNPPLKRLPKKTKHYGWECAECLEKSQHVIANPSGSRTPRTRYNKDGQLIPLNRYALNNLSNFPQLANDQTFRRSRTRNTSSLDDISEALPSVSSLLSGSTNSFNTERNSKALKRRFCEDSTPNSTPNSTVRKSKLLNLFSDESELLQLSQSRDCLVLSEHSNKEKIIPQSFTSDGSLVEEPRVEIANNIDDNISNGSLSVSTLSAFTDNCSNNSPAQEAISSPNVLSENNVLEVQYVNEVERIYELDTDGSEPSNFSFTSAEPVQVIAPVEEQQAHNISNDTESEENSNLDKNNIESLSGCCVS